MKAKPIVIAFIIALCALGVFFLVRSRQAPAASGEDAAPLLPAVQTGVLKRMTLHRYVTGYGVIGPEPATANAPAAGAALAAPSAGVVAGVTVVEGQAVNKGQVLMTINSSSMTAAYASQELQRQRKLYQQHNTSLKMLQDAEVQLALLEVTAPLSGTVVSMNVKPGMAVDASTVVAEVMDLHRQAVTAKIPASQAASLKPGQPVEVLARTPVTGTLAFVSPAVDPNDGTVTVWASLPAHGDISNLRPGQFLPVRIMTATHADCLAAPSESVVTDEQGRSTIALFKNGEADQTGVQTGFEENGWTEVSGAGLKPGGAVITVGGYGLPDKTRVEVLHSNG
ncbi:MAG: efflux RND transporter periplasmic adaptor subunit [Verrucomicrobia bacterium]|nr:efflux RND transporter periplasmic adaptor subunit [Verrucomicrobiota bacterium]MDE3099809.1 efflux RND transporter periplasmic adaptor subunit [Verrucomicrobiota bacterium]